jgi:hypothetical protein
LFICSVASVGLTKAWPRRRDLFARTKSIEAVAINDSVFPADGYNIKFEQLESVWETFCINSPVLPRAPLRTRLHEITDNRNAISHGRESPTTIGGRYSVQDLERILSEIDELCTYVVNTFEEYVDNEHFLS